MQSLREILPLAVLGLIKDKPAHGGDIYQRLKENYEIETPRPMVYVLLRRLERNGLMVSSWDIQDSGPAKRRYTITEDGLEYLSHGMERLKKVSKIINQLIAEKT
ncbi:MAG: PadR family transcriptional regulator [Dehalococcoidales bacterium]|nr:PadR family transcriptional regulator [Dehalococcoidales bacterium]